jgi:hypothetical protein
MHVALRSAETPLVPYDNYVEFVDMFGQMCEDYAELIRAAVHTRIQPGQQNSWPHFSQHELMVLGLAEFDDLREAGMRVLLRMTKRCGVRFCCRLNDVIINSVTTACRTYVNTIGGFRNLHADLGFLLNRQDMTRHMLEAFMMTCGNCDTHSGCVGSELFFTNFTVWDRPDKAYRTYFPISALPDFFCAFAMTAHENLLLSPGVKLTDDILAIIYSHMQ